VVLVGYSSFFAYRPARRVARACSSAIAYDKSAITSSLLSSLVRKGVIIVIVSCLLHGRILTRALIGLIVADFSGLSAGAFTGSKLSRVAK